jgi:hypothetical protein
VELDDVQLRSPGRRLGMVTQIDLGHTHAITTRVALTRIFQAARVADLRYCLSMG